MSADEPAVFDCDAASDACRDMWLGLARCFKDTVAAPDWAVDPEHIKTLLLFAQAAEACFWRATGDETASDVHSVLAAIAKATEPEAA
jgi:hypothetical protein